MAESTEMYLDRLRRANQRLTNKKIKVPQVKNVYGDIIRGTKRQRYESLDTLSTAIDVYFSQFEGEIRDENGEVIQNDKYPTIAGLLYTLGIPNKHTFEGFKSRGEEWADVIDLTLTRMEMHKNDLLLKGGNTTQAAIFDLKNNHKWADKVEQTTTVNPGGALATLLTEIQGRVLRPSIAAVASEEALEAQYAEYSPVEVSVPQEPAQESDTLGIEDLLG